MKATYQDEGLGDFRWGAIRMDLGLTGKAALATGLSCIIDRGGS
jgi:hypothetical protein